MAMFVALQLAHVSAVEHVRSTWRELAVNEAFRSTRFWELAVPATLMHANVQHILLNLWCLFVLGVKFERRYKPELLMALWIIVAYASNGLELIFSGFAKVGLSGLTYTLLGFALFNLRDVIIHPRVRWTAVGMLGLLGWGLLELIHAAPTDSGIGHVAHLFGVAFGLILAFLDQRTFRRPRGA